MRISDWSSDVCSSDLDLRLAGGGHSHASGFALFRGHVGEAAFPSRLFPGRGRWWVCQTFEDEILSCLRLVLRTFRTATGASCAGRYHEVLLVLKEEIGRASCRERVCQYV